MFNKDASGRTHHDTPLMIATVSNNVEIVTLLVERGADLEMRSITYTPYSTALLAAITRGHDEVARVLLDHGANIEASYSEYDISPLHCAIASRQAYCVEILLERCPDIEGLCKDQTPLARALKGWVTAVSGDGSCDYTLERITKLLLNAGADVEAPSVVMFISAHKGTKEWKVLGLSSILGVPEPAPRTVWSYLLG